MKNKECECPYCRLMRGIVLSHQMFDEPIEITEHSEGEIKINAQIKD